MLRKKIFVRTIVGLLMLLVIGILQASGQEAPKRGGSLRVISTGGDIRSMGYAPDIRILYQALYAQPVCETLLKWDKKGELVPHLAERWEIANDLKSVIFFLRKGVKFHDGTDFDAKAVKFNLDEFKKSGRTELDPVSSIDVLDKYTIRLNLKTFNNQLFTIMAMGTGYMASPTALKEMGVEKFGKNPVGTGPFKLKSWARDLSIKFERFDNYWQKGKPYLDTFEWVLIKDPMTALSALMAGDGDAMFQVPFTQVADLKKKGYKINVVPSDNLSMAGNTVDADSPFTKINVRQAVSHAVDSQALAETFYPGIDAEVTNQISSPRSWGYNKNVVGYPYNPQKAKKLLVEAGYPNGFKTTLWWLNTSNMPQIAQAIQAYLKEVGIDVEVKLIPISGWLDKIRSGWDGLIFLSPQLAIPDDSRDAFMLSHCKGRLWKSVQCIEELENQINKVVSAPDFDTKAATMQEYNKLLVDKYCLVHLFAVNPKVMVIKNYVRNSELFEISWVQSDLANAYLSK